MRGKLRMDPSGRHVERKDGKALEEGLGQGRSPGSNLGVPGAVDPMKKLARGDHGEEKLLSATTRKLSLEIKASPFVIDEDARVDQESHGSRIGLRRDSFRASATSASKASNSSGER